MVDNIYDFKSAQDYSCYLIDDDQEELEIFQMALSFLPKPVSCSYFKSPRTAIEGWKEGAVPPSYIFLELNMPAVDMQDELRKLQDAFPLPPTHVIIYSFPFSQDLIRTMTGLENLHLIEKQISVETLANKLKEVFV